MNLSTSSTDITSLSFNIDDYINRIFPTENSLVNILGKDGEDRPNEGEKEEGYDLDYKIEQLNTEYTKLKGELSRDMKTWSTVRLNTTSNITKCESEIQELCNIISIIRTESELSEKMVDDICSDIKLLDKCKSNLLNMITIFKRANMYVSASEQLALMVASSQFDSAANLISVLNSLYSILAGEDLPFLKSVKDSISKSKESLFSKIFAEFKSYMIEPTDHIILIPACSALTALGDGSVSNVTEWFISSVYEKFEQERERERREYLSETKDKFDVDSRLGMWKKIAMYYEKNWRDVFPANWLALELLCKYYCSKVANTYSNLLAEPFETASFIRVLQSYIDWEEGQARFFVALNALTGTNSNFTPVGSVTSAFKPYMHSYFDSEQENFAAILSKISQTEKWWPCDENISSGFLSNTLNSMVNQSSQPLVLSESESTFGVGLPARYPSSDTLFLFIKQSLRKAERIKLSPELFKELIALFQRGLTQYAYIVWTRMPTTRKYGTFTFEKSPFTSGYDNTVEDNVKLTDLNFHHVHALTVVVNTSEYIAETLGQLSDFSAIKSLYAVEIAKFTEQPFDVFEINNSHFDTLLHSALSGMLTVYSCKLNLNLSSGNWDLDTVGDVSNWVTSNQTISDEYIKVVKEHMTKTYMTYFYTQLVSNFTSKYLSNILKIRKIGHVGIQQLLLDCSALKSYFVSLNDSVGFVRYAKSEFGKIEGTLKAISAPNTSIVPTYIAAVGVTNIQDFNKVLDFKKVNLNDRATILDQYRAATKTTGQLDGEMKSPNIGATTASFDDDFTLTNPLKMFF